MRKVIRYILCLVSVLAFASCIENDLSYPDVPAEFTSFVVEGQKSVTIDKNKCRIDVVMGETADLANVKVLSYTMTEGAQVLGGMPQILDLRDSVKLVLKVYEESEWTIVATQPIERYIRCDNQIGDAIIDVNEKIAYVYVNESQSLLDVRFKDMKLEPEGSVLTTTMGFVAQGGISVPKTERCVFPMVLDCVILRYFYVEYKGKEIKWSVKVLQKPLSVGMKSANAWTYSAGLTAVTNGSGVPAFEYRKSGASEWASFDAVQVSGTDVTAVLKGLEPATTYDVRFTNGAENSDAISFTTGPAENLVNLNFDSWSNGDKYPNPDGVTIWDSANSSGAAVTTSPSDDAVKGHAARLESVSAFGMLAAGNIFTGSFVGLAGLGAELDWGTPFTGRPLAMRGYYKYSPKAIDKVKDPYKDMMGKPDQCQILVFLTDWDKPFRVNTNTKQFVDLENDPGIIALGQINSSKVDDGYVSFTLPIVYRSNTRIPKYIVVTGASSRYGDYFTGGRGSVLMMDEFELIYDPAELTADEYAKAFSLVNQY
jgi:hypothetical protein